MKYYFVLSTDGASSLCVAKDETAARVLTGIQEDSDKQYLYELKEDTFDQEGYLLTRK